MHAKAQQVAAAVGPEVARIVPSLTPPQYPFWSAFRALRIPKR